MVHHLVGAPDGEQQRHQGRRTPVGLCSLDEHGGQVTAHRGLAGPVASGPAGAVEEAQHGVVVALEDALVDQALGQRLLESSPEAADEALGAAFLAGHLGPGPGQQVVVGDGAERPHTLAPQQAAVLDDLDPALEGQLDQQRPAEARRHVGRSVGGPGGVVEQQEQQVLRDRGGHGSDGSRTAAGRPRRHP